MKGLLKSGSFFNILEKIIYRLVSLLHTYSIRRQNSVYLLNHGWDILFNRTQSLLLLSLALCKWCSHLKLLYSFGVYRLQALLLVQRAVVTQKAKLAIIWNSCSLKRGPGAVFSWLADNFFREVSQGVFKRKLCAQGANALKSCWRAWNALMWRWKAPKQEGFGAFWVWLTLWFLSSYSTRLK